MKGNSQNKLIFTKPKFTRGTMPPLEYLMMFLRGKVLFETLVVLIIWRESLKAIQMQTAIPKGEHKLVWFAEVLKEELKPKIV